MKFNLDPAAVKYVCLILIAALGVLAENILGKEFLFSLSMGQHQDFRNSIFLLPLLLMIIVFLQYRIENELKKQQAISLLYCLIFYFLSPDYYLAGLYIFCLVGIFFLEKWTRHKIFLSKVFILLVFTLAFTPLMLYSFKLNLSPLHLYFLIVFKSCLMMRLISWALDRRVYKRVNYSSLTDFIEFIFCPIFFVFPGQIQFFLFSYFHQSKTRLTERFSMRQILLLGTWGYFLMLVYSKLDHFFWRHFDQIPRFLGYTSSWVGHWLIGFYWLLVVYFQQTAGMAYQVSLARLIGYNFKYDMHWPLLARTPIDYLRRHSSYVKDYIVEMGLKPLALPLIRRGLSPTFVYSFTAILSYSFFLSLQTGFRPDYERPWLVTLAMILFLILFVSLPSVAKILNISILPSATTMHDGLPSGVDDKPLSRWVLKDYMLWLGTIVILGAYKACLGFAKQ